jgi:hypothetical protein
MNKYTLDTTDQFLDIVADLVVQLKVAEINLESEQARALEMELLSYLKGQV